MGVSIIADLFMEAIEVITSKEKVITIGEHEIKVKAWNATVANLTLLALGSSAPEILLNVIETVGGDFFSGSLGPSTIVGSAAFNLLVILSVCCTALPEGTGRRIAELDVFLVTAIASLFAYLWVLIILEFSSPNVVTVVEGTLTFAFFPVLIAIAYAADTGFFRRMCKSPSAVTPEDAAVAHITSISCGGLAPAQCKVLANQLKVSSVDFLEMKRATSPLGTTPPLSLPPGAGSISCPVISLSLSLSLSHYARKLMGPSDLPHASLTCHRIRVRTPILIISRRQ